MSDESRDVVRGRARDPHRRRGSSASRRPSPSRPGPSNGERIRDRRPDRTTDLLVLNTPAPPVQWQAIAYAQLGDPALSSGIEEAITAYDEHAHALGITEVHHAFVVQHRPRAPDRPYWSIELSTAATPSSWEEIASFMRGVALAGLTDDELAQVSVRPRRGAKLARALSLDEPLREPALTVTFEAGTIAASSVVAEAGAALLELLAHDPSVAVAIERFGEANGSAPEETRAIVVGFVREALARGFLVPA